MPSSTATLFISAVTDEFGSYRDAVNKFLDMPGVRIETQEKFVAAGETMLVKLSDYIQQCDAVVHLIGDRAGNQTSGGVANPVDVQYLLEVLPELPRVVDLDVEALNTLSYTQWEAWLALYHRKKLFIAIPEPAAHRDSTLTSPSEARRQAERQQTHLEALATRGRYPEIRFANSDQLCLGLVPLRDLLAEGSQSRLVLTNILSLADYRAGLAGFRRFLSSEHLPFQAPDPGASSHPAQLLKSLETTADGRGVLLSGVGGVGKTRTTFETAQLAETYHWRVIYVLPGQPSATAENIMEAVLAYGPGKTMVVIEYLDQMHELDLGVLRRHIIQAASRLAIQFGLIANCRPGFLLKPRPERDASFEVVTLAPSAVDAHRLASYVAGYTAPIALSSLGKVELMRLCGHRPIIALLVAQQLEQLATASQLYPAELAAVRSGDLAHWLRRRLAEDHLIVPEADSIWEASKPEPHVVAAAAALACAPDEQTGLIAAAASAFKEVGYSSTTAARVVSILISVGWLEREGILLQTVHDVVADEVVEQISFDLDAVRPAEVQALLSPALNRARSVGRLAKTLTRVEGALSPSRAASLRSSVGLWLTGKATDLGKALAQVDPDTGSYALGAVLGGSLMEDFAIEQWATLVTPWLDEYKTRYEARHLLFRGLRSRQHRAMTELISIGLTWLDHWHTEYGASFVLGPLLHVTAESTDTADEIIQMSLQWLARFHERMEAEFVLNALLRRVDLKPQQAEHATMLALQWLQSFIEKEDAGFVLRSLLERASLKGRQATQVTILASQWLKRFIKTEEAGFVLPAFLGREELNESPEGEEEAAVSLALQWLTHFRNHEDARFVLHALLGRDDLKAELAEQSIALALHWLPRFSEHVEAGFVFDALLSRADLKADAEEDVVMLSMQWLTRFGEAPEAEFVLNPLLGRPNLKPIVATQALTLALKWLKSEVSQVDFVLRRLLSNAALKGKAAELVITSAIQWLSRKTETADAGFVLKPLLSNPNLRGELAEEAIRLALRWLAGYNETPEAGFVLNPLLVRLDLTGDLAQRVTALALQWLARYADKEYAGFVLSPLLSRVDLQPAVETQVIALTLQWLEHFSEALHADFLLKSLLGKTDLNGEAAEQVIALTLRWLRCFGGTAEAKFVLNPLLGRSDLTGDLAQQSIGASLQWLLSFNESLEAGFVLTPLLERRDLKEVSEQRAKTLALQWLALFIETPQAGFVLAALLQNVLGRDSGEQTIGLTLQWLAVFRLKRQATFVLSPLLRRKDLTGDPARRTIKLALEWLELFSEEGAAEFVLKYMVGREDVKGDQSRHMVNRALQWLACMDSPHADFVLRHLLRRNDLEENSQTQIIARALQWLTKFGEARRAAFLLIALLEFIEPTSIASSMAADVLGELRRWLHIWGGDSEAGFVLVEWLGSEWSAIDGLTDLRATADLWASTHMTGASNGPAIAIRLLLSTSAETAELVVAAKNWIGEHDDHPAAAKILSALLAKSSGDQTSLNFVVDRALNVARPNDGSRFRRLLRRSLTKLPLDDPRRHEIESRLGL